MLTGLIRLKAMSNSLNLQQTDDANITYFCKKKMDRVSEMEERDYYWLAHQLKFRSTERIEGCRAEDQVK